MGLYYGTSRDGMSPRRLGFDLTSLRVGFVVDKFVLDRYFS